MMSNFQEVLLDLKWTELLCDKSCFMCNTDKEVLVKRFGNVIFCSILGLSCVQSMKPQYVRNADGVLVPNLSTCAKANFPAEARKIVKSAEVSMRLVVDKFGNVREIKNIQVTLREIVDAQRAESTIPYFEEAAKKAFGDRKCPIHYKDDQPVGYAILVPLKYIDGPGGDRAKVYLEE